MDTLNNDILELLNYTFNNICNQISEYKNINISDNDKLKMWKNFINTKNIESNIDGCCHILAKKSAGNLCGKNISKLSVTKKYCRAHLKYETTDNTAEKYGNNSTKVIKVAIKKSVYGNFIHEKTKLIINPNSKTIIGKEGDKGIINPLNKIDIEMCKSLRFIIDTKCKII